MINKKSILCFLLAIILIAPTLLLSGCTFGFFGNVNDGYFAVVSTDKYYKATLSSRVKTENDDFSHYWTVLRKSQNLFGEDYDVIYIEYEFVDNNGRISNYSKTMMYVNQTVLKLEGNSWQKDYSNSFGDNWSDIYGSMSKPGSFVYELTQHINGRDFPSRFKTATTNEYIEYTFNSYNEKFRISNDEYHVLLYYNFEYGETLNHHEASFVYGNPTEVIPHLNTITSEMVGA